MGTVTSSTYIDAPVEDVFAAFTDFATSHERISGVERSEVVGGGEVGVGTIVRETRRMGGRSHTEEFEVTRFDVGRSCAMKCESCGMRYDFEFHFRPEGGGTRVDATFEDRPQTPMARIMGFVMGPMARSMCRKAMERDFADLKAWIEGGGAEGAAGAQAAPA